MDRETFLTLIPAYTLGALDDTERVEFEKLLAGDAEAQTLLAEYQQTADTLLGGVAYQPAPAHLTADLRRRLAESRPGPRPVSRLPRRLLALAAALTVLLGAALLLRIASDITDDGSPAQYYQRLLAGEDTLRLAVNPLEGSEQVQGELVTNGRVAVIAVDNLPDLAPDQTFQLWLAAPDGVVSGGLFQAAPDNMTYVLVPLYRPFSEYEGFGVSIEPAGGSPFPDRRSGPAVFRVRPGET